MCAKFELFRLILFSSVLDNCWQLLITDDSWYRKCWAECFIHSLKVIHIPNLSSRLIFIFINCSQLLTAIDCWWQLLWKNINWNFNVHTKLIYVPNFSFLGWFLFSSAVSTCNQLLTADRKKIWLEFLCLHWSCYLCQISAL